MCAELNGSVSAILAWNVYWRHLLDHCAATRLQFALGYAVPILVSAVILLQRIVTGNHAEALGRRSAGQSRRGDPQLDTRSPAPRSAVVAARFRGSTEARSRQLGDGSVSLSEQQRTPGRWVSPEESPAWRCQTVASRGASRRSRTGCRRRRTRRAAPTPAARLPMRSPRLRRSRPARPRTVR